MTECLQRGERINVEDWGLRMIDDCLEAWLLLVAAIIIFDGRQRERREVYPYLPISTCEAALLHDT